MAKKRSRSIKDLFFMQEGIDLVFGDTFSNARNKVGAQGVWLPPVDIYETGTEIILKAELPGLESKDFQIEVENNSISLSGERHFNKNLTEENYHRMERSYGVFKRVFSLPDIVDRDKVKASYTNGVLEITVPKAAQPKITKINIE